MPTQLKYSQGSYGIVWFRLKQKIAIAGGLLNAVNG
jgi:hypothetical protein